MEIRELVWDTIGVPARGSSWFIVTKRAGASQFDAAAIAAGRAWKRDCPA
jgi:hypothetical protein